MAAEIKTERTSPSPFKDKVASYLKNLTGALGMENIVEKQQEKVTRILDRNNDIAKLIESTGPDGYKNVVAEEIKLRGEAKLGFVYCIDGRIPTIFIAGRFANAWEEPAGLIGTSETDSGERIPKSTILGQALEEAVRENRDVLEVFFAHTGTVDGPNTCGYMNQLKKDLGLGDDVDLTAENIRRFETNDIPAVTEFYNRVSLQKGKTPLSRVGISAVYETDTMGMVLNYGQEGRQFSTTDFINSIRGDIEFILGENLGSFGSMRNGFSDPENFKKVTQRVLEVTKFIMDQKRFMDIIDPYLAENYSDLTGSQLQALRFMLVRTMSLQYVTGLSVPNPGVDHTFTHHQEDYLSVSLAGKPVGRFDPKEQVFASTPSDTITAVKDIQLKLSLMDKHDAKKPYILFVSNPVKKADWDKYVLSESEAINRNVALNASLFKTIVADGILKSRIKDGSLIVVPVLVDQNTGEVLEVVDHSASV